MHGKKKCINVGCRVQFSFSHLYYYTLLTTGEIENLIYSRRCCHFEWSLRPCLICFLDAILDNNNVQNAGVVVYL